MLNSDMRRARGIEVYSTMSGSDSEGCAIAEALESRGALGGSIALRTAAGEIWARTGLSRRDKSLTAISMLTALGREADLRPLLIGGLNHGLTHDEIEEIFVQIGAYAGLPVAFAGANVANQVFADRADTKRRESKPSALEERAPE